MLLRISLATLFFILSIHSHAATSQKKVIQFSFDQGTYTWTGEFTDYPLHEEQFFELTWGWENFSLLNADKHTIESKGIFLGGNNHSDDLFMFIKSSVSGLKPNTRYAVSLTVDLATNVPEGLTGIGGSPGESVILKIGASTKEPHKILSKDKHYKLNLDKGDQAAGGKNAVIAGSLGNSLVNPDISPEKRPFAFKQINNEANPILVKSDKTGTLWIFTGSDSGFEGASKYYITKITAKLVKR